MASANLSPLPSGAPTLGPSGAPASGPGDAQEPFVCGTFTVTNTGTASDVINWIDGTLTIPFTPTGVIAMRNGGTATTVNQGIANVTAISSTSVTLNYPAALGAGTVIGTLCGYK